MTALYIIGGLAALYLILSFIIAVFLFRMAFCRNFKLPQFFVPKTKNDPWHSLPDSVKADRAWFNTSPDVQEVFITSRDGLKLRGRYMPCEGSKRTVLLMHGYRSTGGDADFCYTLGTYRDMGFNMLVIDERAHGKSEGKYLGMGVMERFDCKDWLEFINREYAPRDIFLHGLSMGCATVLMASGLELPKNLRGIIADCGFTSAYEEMKYCVTKVLHLPAQPIVGMMRLFVKLLAKYDLRACSTIDAMKTQKRPILFIHGERDNFVPTFMGVANHAACTAEKELLIVPKAAHAGSFLVEPERCKKALTSFIERHTTL